MPTLLGPAEIGRTDALWFLMQRREDSVHAIITDPPYPSLEKHRARGTTTRLVGESKWFPTVTWEYLDACFEQFYRVLKDPGIAFVMGDWEAVHDHYYPSAERHGFTCWPPLVWEKGRRGMGYHGARRHEYIGYFTKGKHKLTHKRLESVLFHKALRGKGYYPTQKPKELFAELLVAAVRNLPEISVLDPFAGARTISAARSCCEYHRVLVIMNDKMWRKES